MCRLSKTLPFSQPLPCRIRGAVRAPCVRLFPEETVLPSATCRNRGADCISGLTRMTKLSSSSHTNFYDCHLWLKPFNGECSQQGLAQWSGLSASGADWWESSSRAQSRDVWRHQTRRTAERMTKKAFLERSLMNGERIFSTLSLFQKRQILLVPSGSTEKKSSPKMDKLKISFYFISFYLFLTRVPRRLQPWTLNTSFG